MTTLKRVAQLTVIPGADPVLPSERQYKWAVYEYNGVLDYLNDGINRISDARHFAESRLIPDDQLTLEQVAKVSFIHRAPLDCPMIAGSGGSAMGMPPKSPPPPPPAPPTPPRPSIPPNIPQPQPTPVKSSGFGGWGAVAGGGGGGSGAGYIRSRNPVTGQSDYTFYGYTPSAPGSAYFGTYDFLLR